jgi:hypothetical protein
VDAKSLLVITDIANPTTRRSSEFTRPSTTGTSYASSRARPIPSPSSSQTILSPTSHSTSTFELSSTPESSPSHSLNAPSTASAADIVTLPHETPLLSITSRVAHSSSANAPDITYHNSYSRGEASPPISDPKFTSTGISTSEKIALAVGIPCGVLAIIGLTTGLYYRWSRRRIETDVPAGTPSPSFFRHPSIRRPKMPALNLLKEHDELHENARHGGRSAQVRHDPSSCMSGHGQMPEIDGSEAPRYMAELSGSSRPDYYELDEPRRS